MPNSNPLRGRRTDFVYQQIADQIADGTYPPDSRLPTEGELCERFSVGRVTVRRALARLAESNLIQTRQGSGSVVCPRPKSDRLRTVSVMYSGPMAQLMELQNTLLNDGFMLNFFAQDQAHWTPGPETAFLRHVKEQRHQALLAFCSPLGDHTAELLQEVAESGVRVIHVDHYSEQLPAESYVLPDYRRAGYAAASVLMVAGCRPVVFAGMRHDGPFSRIMAAGFYDALTDIRGEGAGPFDFPSFADSDYFFDMPRLSKVDAEKRFGDFVTGLPAGSGVVCSTHDRGRDILHRLRQAGRRVPDEVSVIAVETVSGDVIAGMLDTFHFDQSAILSRAAEAAVGESMPDMQELVAPTYERCGTVRTP